VLFSIEHLFGISKPFVHLLWRNSCSGPLLIFIWISFFAIERKILIYFVY
jgi:hypothetical protein